MPKYRAALAAKMRSLGYVLRRLSLDERADKLVEFSVVMMRRKLNRDDAKCLLQNWGPYGPNETWLMPNGRKMPRTAKSTRKVKKASKRIASKAASKATSKVR